MVRHNSPTTRGYMPKFKERAVTEPCHRQSWYRRKGVAVQLAGSTDLVADVVGWFSSASSFSGTVALKPELCLRWGEAGDFLAAWPPGSRNWCRRGAKAVCQRFDDRPRALKAPVPIESGRVFAGAGDMESA